MLTFSTELKHLEKFPKLGFTTEGLVAYMLCLTPAENSRF